ncbi:hypothetical protein DOTSEDRAFT_37234 [Dothistroma septosporum NZE10]|uniref:Uncharacterized protein n=1 Tax=Dothistroma septosporum (strain NZE10 / CBS 128990) TaxID=675120 RepID=N1PHT3_DOTSN|nr:hypothetical protein DOTSEDRAFT_37234 [Dothistroma septosporum NZE10]
MQIRESHSKPDGQNTTGLSDSRFHRIVSQHQHDKHNDLPRPQLNFADSESRQSSYFSNISLVEIIDVEPNKQSISTFEDDNDDVKGDRVSSKPVARFMAWFMRCLCMCFRR